MLELTLGISDEDAVFAVRPTLEGRTYVNASNSLKMQGQKRVASELRTMDTTAAAIIENLEEKLYVPDKLPPTLRGLVFKVLGNSLGMIWKGIQSLRHPKDYERQYLAAVEKQLLDLEGEVETTLSLGRFAEHVINRVIVDMEIVLAIIFAAEIAKMRIKGLFKKDAPEVHDLVASLERSLPNNVTIEMGLAMVRLAQYREIGACDSGEEFTNKLKAGDFTPEFTQAWERFMQQYGFRCPMEMDPSTARPYEQPGHLFEQLRTLALNPDPVQNPEALYERGLAERQQAYTQL